MKIHSLGPHTFQSPTHQNHHEWLSRFTPRERHQLIEEDCTARWAAFGIIVGAVIFGLVVALVSWLVIGL